MTEILARTAEQGQWVEIHDVVLLPGERAPQVPDDTAQVALEMRVRGFLLTEKAEVGERVWIRTRIGREIEGILSKVGPSYEHDFGLPQPELLTIGRELRELLEGGRNQDG